MDWQDQREVQTREPEGEKQVPAENWYDDLSLEEAKNVIRLNLVYAATSFIEIGYCLKYIRDRELFREDGFETVWDFAMEEYGISKSTASCYMKMNDRFSKDGNSPEIQERYQGFGKSQLQEMLSLDEEQLEQVTPADRVEDIRAMKKPREIPYIEIPGQVSLGDFPGIEPEERIAQEVPLLHVGLPEEKRNGSCTVTIGELIGAGEEAGQAEAGTETAGEPGEMDEAEDWEEAEPQEKMKPELPDPAMEVDIESYQMSGESQHVFLTPGDVVIICNILHEYAAHLTELAEQAETGFPQMRQRLYAERCKRIQEKIETAIGYSTAEALERCRRKKPSKRDDVGEDAFVLALRKRDRGEKEGTAGADKEEGDGEFLLDSGVRRPV